MKAKILEMKKEIIMNKKRELKISFLGNKISTFSPDIGCIKLNNENIRVNNL